jgi:DNA processing protein
LAIDIGVTQLALLLGRAPGLGPKGIYNVLTRVDAGPNVLSCSVEQMKSYYKLSAKSAEYISQNAETLKVESEELLQKVSALGIHVITVRDNAYPSSLKAYHLHLPPVIYAYGNLHLLQERRFAMINSATISVRGSSATTEIADILIDEGLVMTTGHNNAPYQLALLTAKRKHAPVVLVLDRGIISAFHGQLDWQPVATARIWDPQFDPDRDLVISQFRLGDPWIGENSRLRDRMVFGLSDFVVAGEVRPGGVMEKECRFAMERGRELFVCAFGEDEPGGNQNLLESGVQALDVHESRSQLISLCVAPLFEGRTSDAAEHDEVDIEYEAD